MRLLQRLSALPPTSFNPRFLAVRTLIFLVLLMPLSSLAQSSQNEREYRQSLDQVSKEIKRVTEELNQSKTLLKNERDKLTELEQKMALLRRQREATEAEKEQHQQALANIEARIEEVIESQAETRTALIELVLQRYKSGSPNYLKLLLNQENPYAAGRLSHFYRYFSAAQNTKLDQLAEQLTQVKELRTTATAKKQELDASEQQLTAQADSLQSMRQERRSRVAALDREVTESSTKLEQLQADRQRLNNLIVEIAKQAERLRELERRRQQEQAAQQNNTVATTRPRPTRQPVAGGFKKQRGRLTPPVEGKLDYGFGSRLVQSGLPSQGHFYQTNNNQTVAAVFRGRVLFADYLKGYGLLLIIDHGDEHISLYGHNEVIYKRVGDSVDTGEAVAKSGVSGGLENPGLYFEIRHNAVPVDPKRWLSD